MKKSFVLACLVSTLSFAMNACDEGVYRDGSCDENYVSECLDSTHIMNCEGGQLVAKPCLGESICVLSTSTNADGTTTSAAKCVSGDAPYLPCDCSTGANCSADDLAACPAPKCDCTTGANCTDEEKAACEAPKCNCETGENCTDEEKAACEAPKCDCETGENCTDEEKAACDAPKCDCETGENCTDEEKAACEAPKCDCETGENCTDEEKVACEAPTCDCETGENCTDEEKAACADPCNGISCEAGVCDRGVCVTDDMKALEDGDPCDYETFEEFCDGDTIVYCDYNDDYSATNVVKMKCEGASNACTIIAMDDAKYAFCRGEEADQCEKDGQKLFFCEVDDYGPYESFATCYKNTENEFTVVGSSNYGECDDAACDEKGERCVNEPEPYFCDADYKCSEDGTVLDICMDLGFFGVISASYTCADEIPGSTCNTIKGDAYCRTACSELNASVASCEYDEEEDSYSLFVSTCSEGDDGKLYDDVRSTECAHGCNDTNTACVKLVDNEGEACGADFADACNGDMIVTCYYGEVAAENCEEGTTCAIDSEGAAYCKKQKIENFEIQEVPADQDNTQDAACDEDTFVENCDGSKIVYCYDGAVDIVDCNDDGTNEYACQVTLYSGANYADCVNTDASYKCEDDQIGEILSVCIDLEDGAGVFDFTCTQFDGGNFYYLDSPYGAPCDLSCAEGCMAE